MSVLQPVKMTNHELGKTTLKQLMEDSRSVSVTRVLLHQAFAIPKAGMESTISDHRIKGIKMVVHPGYGVICEYKDECFLIPDANVVVAHG